MSLTVKLFARARDLAGTGTLVLDLPAGSSIADLRSALGERVPALSPLLPVLLLAVNGEYAAEESVIPEEAEIAGFPPVSGG